ncbi:Hsp20 family protein [Terriglobus sp. ADX1]
MNVADDLMQEMKRIDDEIRQFAFHLFQRRGAFSGMELEDWLKAEQALLHPVAMSIEENDHEVILRADVPGFNEEDLKVHVGKHSLKICGKTEQHQKSQEGPAFSTQRSMRSIRTDVPLPTAVNADQTVFHVSDGVLTVTMPKLQHQAKQEAEKAA